MRARFLSRMALLATAFAITSYSANAAETAVAVSPLPATSQLSSMEAMPLRRSITLDGRAGSKMNRSSANKWTILGDTTLRYEEEFSKNSISSTSFFGGIRRLHFGYSDIHPHSHYYGVLGVKGEYKTDDQWIWNGALQVEVPFKSVLNISSDSRFIGGFEGKYQLKEGVNLFIGLTAQTGIRATTVQPIIGAQYLWKDWILDVVYPTPKITYQGVEKWKFSYNIEPIYTAMRSKTVDIYRKGVVLIKGASSEFRADYTFSKDVQVWAGIGTICRAKSITGDKHFHHKQKDKIRKVAYAHAGISYTI